MEKIKRVCKSVYFTEKEYETLNKVAKNKSVPTSIYIRAKLMEIVRNEEKEIGKNIK